MVRRSVSQPFDATPSQFAKPALQLATVQAPDAQPAVPFDTEHTVPQPPQLDTFVAVLISQPSVAVPLQSRKDPLQVAIVQRLAAQPYVATFEYT